MTHRHLIELTVLLCLIFAAAAWWLRDLVWLWQQFDSFDVQVTW